MLTRTTVAVRRTRQEARRALNDLLNEGVVEPAEQPLVQPVEEDGETAYAVTVLG